MQVLNLVNKANGTVNYDIINFSDTQQLLTVTAIDLAKSYHTVRIKSRFSWKDLQTIILANQALKKWGFKDIHLEIPFFLGSRSDRSFSQFGVNYLKDVICPIINAQGFASVTVTDPHSNCLEMGVQNFRKKSNAELVQWALEDIYVNIGKEVIWLIPDKGATDKAYSTIKDVYFGGDVIECGKKRDTQGNIVETTMPHGRVFEQETAIIVDDICSGGRTFIELAKIAKQRGIGKMYLIVTHFEGGKIPENTLLNLYEYFEGVYCTNSMSDLDWKQLNQLNIFE